MVHLDEVTLFKSRVAEPPNPVVVAGVGAQLQPRTQYSLDGLVASPSATAAAPARRPGLHPQGPRGKEALQRRPSPLAFW